MIIISRQKIYAFINIVLCMSLTFATPPRTVTTIQEFDTILTYTKTPMVVTFSASWCGICIAIKEQLAALMNDQMLNSLITFILVDFDTAKELCDHYHIDRVPIFCFFNNGKKIKQLVGVRNKDTFKEQFRNELITTFGLPIQKERTITALHRHHMINRFFIWSLNNLKDGIEWCLEKLTA